MDPNDPVDQIEMEEVEEEVVEEVHGHEDPDQRDRLQRIPLLPLEPFRQGQVEPTANQPGEEHNPRHIWTDYARYFPPEIDVPRLAVQVEPYWANLEFYQRQDPIGRYDAHHLEIGVRGYDSRRAQDFCLSRYDLPEDAEIAQVRQNIGHGFTLRTENGDVFLRNLSEISIFAHNATANFSVGANPGTVVEIPPGRILKTFDAKWFWKTMSISIMDDNAYESVAAMREMATIQVGIGHGWRPRTQYVIPQDIPCWINVSLLGAMIWLENVLAKLIPPPRV